jgi:multidrug efflux pump subunit AcrA (membrane-fusion protein)
LQIGEATMKADTDGVIVRADDLDSKRNLRVKEGDILMEIAPTTTFRAELAVSEKDIQDIREANVQPGNPQKVEFAATSFPGDEIIGHIDRVAAPGEAKEGDNVFKVYATIDKGQLRSWIRQGMAGEARVDVGKRRLVWIWTHRLIEFLQLKLWM